MAAGPRLTGGRQTTSATIGQDWPAPGPNSFEAAQELQAIVAPIGGKREPLMRSANSSFGMPPALWSQRREATLNWLALGLLLTAWNAVDDDASPPRRPDSLR